MISSVHLSPKMSRVVLIGHADLLVIFFILKNIYELLAKSKLMFYITCNSQVYPGELMVIKPDIPRKVRVLQKIDCQEEEEL
jgi:hypothetical protein